MLAAVTIVATAETPRLDPAALADLAPLQAAFAPQALAKPGQRN